MILALCETNMSIFALNQDCLTLIFNMLPFDDLQNLRKTCMFFNEFPRKREENVIIKCGHHIKVRESTTFKCRHFVCSRVVLDRVRRGKTTKVGVDDDYHNYSYYYRYSLFKLNQDCLYKSDIRCIFEFGLRENKVYMVMDTYRIVFQCLREFYEAELEISNLVDPVDEYLQSPQKYIIEAVYYKRALANFGLDLEILELLEILDPENYPEWEEDEDYVFYDNVDMEYAIEIYENSQDFALDLE